MKLRCNRCGNEARFRASQACRGTIPVIVDGNGHWMENATTDGRVPEADLDFDDPEGPFECAGCGAEVQPEQQA